MLAAASFLRVIHLILAVSPWVEVDVCLSLIPRVILSVGIASDKSNCILSSLRRCIRGCC